MGVYRYRPGNTDRLTRGTGSIRDEAGSREDPGHHDHDGIVVGYRSAAHPGYRYDDPSGGARPWHRISDQHDTDRLRGYADPLPGGSARAVRGVSGFRPRQADHLPAAQPF